MRRSKLIACTCEYCGEKFYAKTQARFCIEKSTCRVNAKRKRDAVNAVAKAMTMDMEAYADYIRVTDGAPYAKQAIEDAIVSHGLQAAKSWLAIIVGMQAVAGI